MKNRTKGLAVAAGIVMSLLLQACGNQKEEPKQAVTQAVKTGKPKIAVAENTFNFGKVKQGVQVEHVFKISNKGQADLIIDKARGS